MFMIIERAVKSISITIDSEFSFVVGARNCGMIWLVDTPGYKTAEPAHPNYSSGFHVRAQKKSISYFDSVSGIQGLTVVVGPGITIALSRATESPFCKRPFFELKERPKL